MREWVLTMDPTGCEGVETPPCFLTKVPGEQTVEEVVGTWGWNLGEVGGGTRGEDFCHYGTLWWYINLYCLQGGTKFAGSSSVMYTKIVIEPNPLNWQL